MLLVVVVVAGPRVEDEACRPRVAARKEERWEREARIKSLSDRHRRGRCTMHDAHTARGSQGKFLDLISALLSRRYALIEG